MKEDLREMNRNFVQLMEKRYGTKWNAARRPIPISRSSNCSYYFDALHFIPSRELFELCRTEM